MSDIKSKIFSSIAEISLQDAVIKINSALPSNISLISLKANVNSLESSFYSGLISSADYNVEITKFRKALFFHIDRLSYFDLKKVFTIFYPEEEFNNENLGNSESNNYNKTSILFIAASPNDQDHLQIEYEYANITKVINSSLHRSYFNLQKPVFAATIFDLLSSLNNSLPNLLHFSGHSGKKGIILSDNTNKAEIIPTDILYDLFKTLDIPLHCIFLNACYSNEQAKVLSRFSKYIIGMNISINDGSAIIFSEAFYSSLCNSSSINYEKAFMQSRTLLKLRSNEESSIPVIWKDGEILDM